MARSAAIAFTGDKANNHLENRIARQKNLEPPDLAAVMETSSTRGIDQQARADADIPTGPNTTGPQSNRESAKAIQDSLRTPKNSRQDAQETQDRVGKRKVPQTKERFVSDVVSGGLAGISRHRGPVVADYKARIKIYLVAFVQGSQTKFGFFTEVMQFFIVSTQSEKQLTLQ